MNLSITQQPINGILGGPKHKDFAVSVNNIAFNISIDQQCQRELSISSSAGKYEDMISIYYSLVTLLMLFDGHFYPVVKAQDGTDITESWNPKGKPLYRQKPGVITKQKPDKDKKIKNQNAERAKQLGLQYIPHV